MDRSRFRSFCLFEFPEYETSLSFVLFESLLYWKKNKDLVLLAIQFGWTKRGNLTIETESNGFSTALTYHQYFRSCRSVSLRKSTNWYNNEYCSITQIQIKSNETNSFLKYGILAESTMCMYYISWKVGCCFCWFCSVLFFVLKDLFGPIWCAWYYSRRQYIR